MRPVAHVFQLYRIAGEDIVWWRYLSANGRCLARCPAPLGSIPEARIAIASTVASLGLTTLAIRATPVGRWRWSLLIGDAPVVVGSGDQDRRTRCEHAGRRFMTGAPCADIDSHVHMFRRRDTAGRSTQVVG